MKYWRGYLTAAISAAFTWGLIQFAKTHTVLVDMIYPYVSRMLVSSLAEWSSSIDICIWQVFALLLVVGIFVSIILMVLLRWNFIQWGGWILATISTIYLFYTIIFGLNYYAGPLSDDIRLNVQEYTVTELENATIFYRDKANDLALQISRNIDGYPEYPEFEELALQVGNGFHTLTKEKVLPVFSGSIVPVKQLGWNNLYANLGILGITISITGESAVNPNCPPPSMPFMMCHEMAHRMSIASDDDANFASFLACSINPILEVQYSAYFMAFLYCYNTLKEISTSTAEACASQIEEGINPMFKQDLETYSSFISTIKNKKTTYSTTPINSYLNVYKNDMPNMYNSFCDMLVCWHIQEYVLPLHEEKKEVFDPYDETSVNLTNIVNKEPIK